MNQDLFRSCALAQHAQSADGVAELLVAVAAQDRAAFRQLYFLTNAKLLGVLIRILRTRCEAEDALQEIFTRVWLKAGMYEAAPERVNDFETVGF